MPSTFFKPSQISNRALNPLALVIVEYVKHAVATNEEHRLAEFAGFTDHPTVDRRSQSPHQ
ncbi:hypothetical protein HHE02_05670 [Helicobacter heilmannii]|nr:hypothetical protein HHE02_05670 [Helicobacter heilmannii]